MPNFPTFTAGTPPPRTSGAVRAQDTDIQAGRQAELRGIGAFGRGLTQAAGLAFQASQNRQAIDDTIEWGTATSRVKNRFNLAADAAQRLDVTVDMPLPDDPDYLKTLASFSEDKRNQLTNDALKDIEGDVSKISTGFKSKENRAKFDNWYTDNYNNLANSVGRMYGAKLDNYQRTEMDKLDC
ncbi:MAG: hypothetical protein ACYSYU_11470 [Planctomycetota bacterium]|jgi:hypothetical protein